MRFIKRIGAGSAADLAVLCVATVIVATTTLTIALYTQVFAASYGPRGERTVVFPGVPIDASFTPRLDAIRDERLVFSDVAAYAEGPVNLNSALGPQEVSAAQVTQQYFAVLDVRPHEGRLPSGSDDQAVVLISRDLARRLAGGRTTSVGTLIAVNGRPMTIIGVVDERVHPAGTQLWMPFGTGSDTMFQESVIIWGIARVRPGVTDERISEALGRAGLGERAAVEELGLRTRRRVTPTLTLISGAVLLLLVLAVMTLAFLQIVNTTHRLGTLRLKLALGATPARLAREMLGGALLVSLSGGVIGLVIATTIWKLLRSMAPADLSLPSTIGTTPGVIGNAVMLVVSVITTAYGAHRAGGPRIGASDFAGQRSGLNRRVTRTAQTLASFQAAAALVLLVLAAGTLRSVHQQLNGNFGFDSTTVVADISLPSRKYATGQRRAQFYSEVLSHLATQAGVESVAATSAAPFSPVGLSILPVLADGTKTPAIVTAVAPGSLAVLGGKILEGRDFTAADRPGALRAAIVSESFARAAFGSSRALGRQLRVASSSVMWEVVGVAADMRDRFEQNSAHVMYVPFAQRPTAAMTLLLRSHRRIDDTSALVKAAVQAVDPDQPVTRIEVLSARIARTAARERLAGATMTCLALAALLMAAAGAYGATALSLRRRRQELALRSTLGASRGALFGMLVKDSGRPILLGTVLGAAGAIPAGQWVGHVLPQFRPSDAQDLGVVAAIHLAIYLLCVGPQLVRAAQTRPTATLMH